MRGWSSEAGNVFSKLFRTFHLVCKTTFCYFVVGYGVIAILSTSILF